MTPLRIAIFANEFPALSETFVLRHITSLIERGHEVTVLSTAPRVEPAQHPAIARFDLRRRTRYLEMPVSRFARVRAAPEAFERGWACGRFAPFRAINVLRYGREAASLRLLHWAATLAPGGEFDVVHCHFGTVGRLAAFLREVGALHGRLVTTFHGVDLSACLRDDPSLYDHLLRHGDLFLPISDVWRQKLLSLGCQPARTIVHRMGVEPERFVFRTRCPAADQPVKLLTVGRLIEKKGVEYGLRAAAELVRRGIKIDYQIAGDGPLRAQLERLAAALEIGSSVRFLGWQNEVQVAALMAERDLLLAPSVTDAIGDQEGIPVTIMEAMAAGMPVVSTWHSGIPELVEHGAAGFLAPERDVVALAEAVERIVRNDLWAAMGHAGRRRVELDYDVRRLDDTLERHYRALIERSAPPQALGTDPAAVAV
ncbi:MAG: glycosyltransferase [Alphaproteobacteria bacterium]